MSTWIIIQYSLSAIVLITASIIDIRTKKIPNYITIPFFVVSLILAIIFEPDSLLPSFIVAISAVILGMVGGMGLGDAKLLMGIAMLNGWKVTLCTFIAALSAFAGLFFAIARKEAAGEVKNAIKTFFLRNSTNSPNGSLKAPFAPFLAFGYAWAILYFATGLFER